MPPSHDEWLNNLDAIPGTPCTARARTQLWWQMPTQLPPRRKPPRPRPSIIADAIVAFGVALTTVSAADFLLWLTS